MLRKEVKFSNEEMRARLEMRKAYDTPSGRQELLRILIDHGIFDQISVDKLEMRNWGIAKLEELGFLDVEVLQIFIDWAFDNLELSYRMTTEEKNLQKDSDL